MSSVGAPAARTTRHLEKVPFLSLSFLGTLAFLLHQNQLSVNFTRLQVETLDRNNLWYPSLSMNLMNKDKVAIIFMFLVTHFHTPPKSQTCNCKFQLIQRFFLGFPSFQSRSKSTPCQLQLAAQRLSHHQW